jgi:hypothetical protein
VDVTVGVDMGWHPPDKAVKLIELALELIAHGVRIGGIEFALVLADDVPMQPNRQSGVVKAHRHRLDDVTSGHHQARAGDDPIHMAFEDAAVYSRRGSEVVGVDD